MSEFVIGNSLWILFLVSAGCNVAHFRHTRAGVLLYQPYFGFPTLFWMVVMLVIGTLYLVGTVSGIWIDLAISPYLIFLNGYSIFRRHRRIKAKGLPPPAVKPPFQFRVGVVLAYLALIILFGALWGFIAIKESSPHPAPWMRNAGPIAGRLAGITFAAVFFLIRKK